MNPWSLCKIGAVALLSGGLPALSGHADASGVAERIWQSSTSQRVTLGVRSKDGGEPYTAEFVVVGPDRVVASTRITVTGDAFGYVNFPDDFNTYWKAGAYRWIARVEGRIVVRGAFHHRATD